MNNFNSELTKGDAMVAYTLASESKLVLSDVPQQYEKPKEREDPLMDKSYAFGLRILKMNEYLKGTRVESSMRKQVFRSGTSINANITEAHYAASRKDFIHKLNIALKETNETKNWINYLLAGKYIDERMHLSITNDCLEILKMLVSSLNTLRSTPGN